MIFLRHKSRPKEINSKNEWKRIEGFFKKTKKFNCLISLDTRKTKIMNIASKYKVDLINDVSGFNYDASTINFLRKTKKPFVIHHSKGSPKTMQKKPDTRSSQCVRCTRIVGNVFAQFSNQ